MVNRQKFSDDLTAFILYQCLHDPDWIIKRLETGDISPNLMNNQFATRRKFEKQGRKLMGKGKTEPKIS
jgi:hypothetical protein